ncbi:MAG TPA: hypothetical protein VGK74_02775 [Symbiobacteriaceae bacterium]|jgi:hypothetical protein
MAVKIFPSANDVAGSAGDGITWKEANATSWLKAIAAADFVISGFLLPATSASLTIAVPLGQAMLQGYWVTIDASTNVVCTASNTNYIYLVLTLDGSSHVTTAGFTANTTGTPPANSLLIGTAVAGASSVTSTVDKRLVGFTLPVMNTNATPPSPGNYVPVTVYNTNVPEHRWAQDSNGALFLQVNTNAAGVPNWVNVLQIADDTGLPTFYQNVTAPSLSATGLTGATAASRYVGATVAGPPVSGTFAVGDFVIDQTAAIWVCSVAGTPGTWGQPGTPAYLDPVAAMLFG